MSTIKDLNLTPEQAVDVVQELLTELTEARDALEMTFGTKFNYHDLYGEGFGFRRWPIEWNISEDFRIVKKEEDFALCSVHKNQKGNICSWGQISKYLVGNTVEEVREKFDQMANAFELDVADMSF